MSEKLIVKNFGPIREATIDLRKTTVFIGPQGSGKSTLAKLVAIFRETEFEDRTVEEFKRLPGLLMIDYGLKNYFKENTIFNYISKYVSIYYHKHVYKLSSNQPSEVSLENQKLSKEELIKKETDLKTPIYIPAERTYISAISGSLFGLINNKIALSKIITEFGSIYENCRKFVSEFSTLAGAVYKHENGKDFIYVEDSKLELSESASGFQAIIPLQIVIEGTDSLDTKEVANIFIIEEPELNLFPTIQKEVVNYLVNRCTKGENELLITTHSPYILSALNNLLLAYKTAEKHPERVDEIAEKIPKESWLNPAEFNAYYVGEGTVASIFDEKNGLIADNALDEISVDLADERDFLMDIYFSEVHEGVN